MMVNRRTHSRRSRTRPLRVGPELDLQFRADRWPRV